MPPDPLSSARFARHASRDYQHHHLKVRGYDPVIYTSTPGVYSFRFRGLGTRLVSTVRSALPPNSWGVKLQLCTVYWPVRCLGSMATPVALAPRSKGPGFTSDQVHEHL